MAVLRAATSGGNQLAHEQRTTGALSKPRLTAMQYMSKLTRGVPGQLSGRGHRGCHRWLDRVATISHEAQSRRTRSAWGPLGPWVTSNSTRWFSSRLRKPLDSIAEKWTNTSLLPSSTVMNPNPLSELNHFTVPCAMV